MIKLFNYIFEHLSTFALGYWPYVFEPITESGELCQSSLTNFSKMVLAILLIISVVQLIKFIIDLFNIGYSKIFIPIVLLYIIGNFIWGFFLLYIAFNILGPVGTWVSAGIYYVVILVIAINQLEEDGKLYGTCDIMGTVSLLLEERASYEEKIKEWKSRYSELLNSNN